MAVIAWAGHRSSVAPEPLQTTSALPRATCKTMGYGMMIVHKVKAKKSHLHDDPDR